MYTAESPTTRDRTALLYHPLIGASNRESPAGITGHQKRPDRQKERQRNRKYKINPLFKTFLAYFLSNFMNLYVLFCTNCIVIDLIGGLLNVYQYYWQQRLKNPSGHEYDPAFQRQWLHSLLQTYKTDRCIAQCFWIQNGL